MLRLPRRLLLRARLLLLGLLLALLLLLLLPWPMPLLFLLLWVAWVLLLLPLPLRKLLPCLLLLHSPHAFPLTATCAACPAAAWLPSLAARLQGPPFGYRPLRLSPVLCPTRPPIPPPPHLTPPPSAPFSSRPASAPPFSPPPRPNPLSPPRSLAFLCFPWGSGPWNFRPFASTWPSLSLASPAGAVCRYPISCLRLSPRRRGFCLLRHPDLRAHLLAPVHRP